MRRAKAQAQDSVIRRLHAIALDILAINYGWIERFQYEPTNGITLHASGQKIRIKGRNLNAKVRPLFQGICRHRVLWVMETERPANLRAGPEATVVERIEW